jgi:release factor glutamine methyltransferase
MERRTWKLLEILDQTSSFFLSKGLENPRLQAEILLAAILEMGRLDLYLHFERTLTDSEVGRYRQFVKRRLDGAPIQYITGKAAFRHLELQVNEAVLIPRPETEVLVDVALRQLESRDSPKVLDVGCGSGAVGISVAFECPAAQVLAVDISLGALRVTRVNADQIQVGERLWTVAGDLFACLNGNALASFDLIVSNPPYVASPEMTALPFEIREFEPRLALDGGEDGLDFYRRLAVDAPQFLAPHGRLVLEVGDDQSQSVMEILGNSGRFAHIACFDDLTETPRVLAANRV